MSIHLICQFRGILFLLTVLFIEFESTVMFLIMFQMIAIFSLILSHL